MKRRLIFIISALFFTSEPESMEINFLSEEEIINAKKLEEYSITFEAFREEQKQKEKKDQLDYFTIKNFKFPYKKQNLELIVAVGSYRNSNWGEVALYSGNANLKKIKYNSGEFSDVGSAELFLANIKFEYVPSTQDHVAYFILQKIDANYKCGGKGYSQACVSYFMNEFIIKHTNVEFVFSDVRNLACQHFFPRYGLQPGMPAPFKGVKFERPVQVPFYWKR